MTPCPPDDVFHPIAKKCVSKSTPAGKILSNPKNKRCKDDKVINPHTNYCTNPVGPTIAPVLMDGHSKAIPPDTFDLIIQYWKYKAYGSVFPKRKVYHEDAKEERQVAINALIAVNRLYKAWSKGTLKTSAQVQKAKPEFDRLQDFAKRFPKVLASPRKTTKAFTNLQRLEFEDPSVASRQHFVISFHTVLEKMLHFDISSNIHPKDAKKLAWDSHYIKSETGEVLLMN